jgi:AcrR family transcriptional regulator
VQGIQSSAGGGARRTQSERTAETREALFDAAIECLVDLGYANTTTREVARRAGVSRGAQTHHFESKAELVVAAIERLFDRQCLRFREGFAALPEDRRTLDQAVALLWEIVSGPSYPAVLEVTVAGRTDPDLRVVVHGLSAVLEQTVVGVLREFFPALDDERLARTIIDLGFTIVQGAAVSSYAGYGDPEHTIRVVRAVAALVTPQTADLLKGALDVLDS